MFLRSKSPLARHRIRDLRVARSNAHPYCRNPGVLHKKEQSYSGPSRWSAEAAYNRGGRLTFKTLTHKGPAAESKVPIRPLTPYTCPYREQPRGTQRTKKTGK